MKEVIFRRDRKVPGLVLVWEGKDGEPDVRQEVTMFSLVDATLQAGDAPLLITVGSPRWRTLVEITMHTMKLGTMHL